MAANWYETALRKTAAVQTARESAPHRGAPTPLQLGCVLSRSVQSRASTVQSSPAFHNIAFPFPGPSPRAASPRTPSQLRSTAAPSSFTMRMPDAVPDAPVYSATLREMDDLAELIAKAGEMAMKYGAVRIDPPHDWQQPPLRMARASRFFVRMQTLPAAPFVDRTPPEPQPSIDVDKEPTPSEGPVPPKRRRRTVNPIVDIDDDDDENNCAEPPPPPPPPPPLPPPSPPPPPPPSSSRNEKQRPDPAVDSAGPPADVSMQVEVLCLKPQALDQDGVEPQIAAQCDPPMAMKLDDPVAVEDPPQHLACAAVALPASDLPRMDGTICPAPNARASPRCDMPLKDDVVISSVNDGNISAIPQPAAKKEALTGKELPSAAVAEEAQNVSELPGTISQRPGVAEATEIPSGSHAMPTGDQPAPPLSTAPPKESLHDVVPEIPSASLAVGKDGPQLASRSPTKAAEMSYRPEELAVAKSAPVPKDQVTPPATSTTDQLRTQASAPPVSSMKSSELDADQRQVIASEVQSVPVNPISDVPEGRGAPQRVPISQNLPLRAPGVQQCAPVSEKAVLSQKCTVPQSGLPQRPKVQDTRRPATRSPSVQKPVPKQRGAATAQDIPMTPSPAVGHREHLLLGRSSLQQDPSFQKIAPRPQGSASLRGPSPVQSPPLRYAAPVSHRGPPTLPAASLSNNTIPMLAKGTTQQFAIGHADSSPSKLTLRSQLLPQINPCMRQGTPVRSAQIVNIHPGGAALPQQPTPLKVQVLSQHVLPPNEQTTDYTVPKIRGDLTQSVRANDVNDMGAFAMSLKPSAIFEPIHEGQDLAGANGAQHASDSYVSGLPRQQSAVFHGNLPGSQVSPIVFHSVPSGPTYSGQACGVPPVVSNGADVQPMGVFRVPAGDVSARIGGFGQGRGSLNAILNHDATWPTISSVPVGQKLAYSAEELSLQPPQAADWNVIQRGGHNASLGASSRSQESKQGQRSDRPCASEHTELGAQESTRETQNVQCLQDLSMGVNLHSTNGIGTAVAKQCFKDLKLPLGPKVLSDGQAQQIIPLPQAPQVARCEEERSSPQEGQVAYVPCTSQGSQTLQKPSNSEELWRSERPSVCGKADASQNISAPQELSASLDQLKSHEPPACRGPLTTEERPSSQGLSTLQQGQGSQRPRATQEELCPQAEPELAPQTRPVSKQSVAVQEAQTSGVAPASRAPPTPQSEAALREPPACHEASTSREALASRVPVLLHESTRDACPPQGVQASPGTQPATEVHASEKLRVSQTSRGKQSVQDKCDIEVRNEVPTSQPAAGAEEPRTASAPQDSVGATALASPTSELAGAELMKATESAMHAIKQERGLGNVVVEAKVRNDAHRVEDRGAPETGDETTPFYCEKVIDSSGQVPLKSKIVPRSRGMAKESKNKRQRVGKPPSKRRVNHVSHMSWDQDDSGRLTAPIIFPDSQRTLSLGAYEKKAVSLQEELRQSLLEDQTLNVDGVKKAGSNDSEDWMRNVDVLEEIFWKSLRKGIGGKPFTVSYGVDVEAEGAFDSAGMSYVEWYGIDETGRLVKKETKKKESSNAEKREGKAEPQGAGVEKNVSGMALDSGSVAALADSKASSHVHGELEKHEGVEMGVVETEVLMDEGQDYSPVRKENMATESTTGAKCHVGNLNRSGLLRHMPRMPGINHSMYYVGQLFTRFCWHVEDAFLNSVSYLHSGSAEKVWYAIPPVHASRFEEYAAENVFSDELVDQFGSGQALLMNKTTIFDPREVRRRGIEVYRVVHRPGSFVLTAPRGYHAGFNCGFNIAEAVNYANPTWFPVGREASRFARESQKPLCVPWEYLLFHEAKSIRDVVKRRSRKPSKRVVKNAEILARELDSVTRVGEKRIREYAAQKNCRIAMLSEIDALVKNNQLGPEFGHGAGMVCTLCGHACHFYAEMCGSCDDSFEARCEKHFGEGHRLCLVPGHRTILVRRHDPVLLADVLTRLEEIAGIKRSTEEIMHRYTGYLRPWETPIRSSGLKLRLNFKLAASRLPPTLTPPKPPREGTRGERRKRSRKRSESAKRGDANSDTDIPRKKKRRRPDATRKREPVQRSEVVIKREVAREEEMVKPVVERIPEAVSKPMYLEVPRKAQKKFPPAI